jgi:uncharacterized protein (TIGR02646 family)
MRYIHKEIKNEPISLKNHRDTEGVTYESIKGLKDALLVEQGFLCAYCMRAISIALGMTGVEHILSREEFPEKQLDYHNLVAVCNGTYGNMPHCDKTKEYHFNAKKFDGKVNGKVQLAKLFPTNADCERLITYNSNGLIKSFNDDLNVEEDLLKLNLNDEKYKAFRKNKIDAARDRLIKSKPTKEWRKKDFEREIEIWTTKKEGKHIDFFPIAVWFLKTESLKAKYK